MTRNWQTKRLGELCEIELGKTPARSNKAFWDEKRKTGNVWLSIADLLNAEDNVVVDSKEYLSDKGAAISKIVSEGTLLVSFKLTLGRLAFAGRDLFTNEAIAALKIFNERELSKEFLFYFLHFFDWRKAAENDVKLKGMTLNKAKLKEMPVSFPALVDQKRIVGILDDAFDSIATAKANGDKNLQNARELFGSYLDFATAGCLTKEWRRDHENVEHASAVLARRLAERHTQFGGKGKYKGPDAPITVKSVDLPKSWILASPEQIAIHIVDCPHSTPRWAKSGVLCLRTTNFKPGFLDLESVQFVSEQTYNERITRLEPKGGDVLYSREGGIMGIACMIPEHMKMCLGQRMMLFRLDTKLALPEYFTAVMNSTLILSEVRRLTNGAASPHLNICDIRRFPIPLPPIAEQHQIVVKLNANSADIQHLESIYQQKLVSLGELKKAILRRAFTGEL
ncbi:restriction endonuclease subunit S [Telmatobacter sp. DSM 110680]|uniref:Restriction endonuclease subunit S n=1 Tax=Telmatobacter sp. DSM 110680 TaxID=3036704 RepID=A0AAU7DPJ2_9BACT